MSLEEITYTIILQARRKALRQLLENEYRTFEEELNKMGLGFIRA